MRICVENMDEVQKYLDENCKGSCRYNAVDVKRCADALVKSLYGYGVTTKNMDGCLRTYGHVPFPKSNIREMTFVLQVGAGALVWLTDASVCPLSGKNIVKLTSGAKKDIIAKVMRRLA